MNAKRHNRPQSPKQNTKKSNSKASAMITGQVRIIGGRYKRQLVPFIDASGLRPSPDRLRETLFNWIQFELHDALVLDLCAGSGVIGFEALSRGANHVTFVERHPKQAHLIETTALKLNISPDSYLLLNQDATVLIPNLPKLLNSQPLGSQPLDSHRLTLQEVSDSNELNAEQETLKTPTEFNHVKLDEPALLKEPALLNEPTFVYHFVFLDPPYDLNLWVPLLNLLIQYKLVDTQTYFYIEDKRDLNQTLEDVEYEYVIIKQTKIGQVFASLIQLKE